MKIIRDRDIATGNTTTCTILMHRMKFSLKKGGEKEKIKKIQNGRQKFKMAVITLSLLKRMPHILKKMILLKD